MAPAGIDTSPNFFMLASRPIRLPSKQNDPKGAANAIGIVNYSRKPCGAVEFRNLPGRAQAWTEKHQQQRQAKQARGGFGDLRTGSIQSDGK